MSSLKERLLNLGIKQSILSKKLGISRTYLNSILNGRYISKSKGKNIKKEIEKFIEEIEKNYPVLEKAEVKELKKKKITLKSKKKKLL